jgi:hypothetical protein
MRDGKKKSREYEEIAEKQLGLVQGNGVGWDKE